MSETRDRRTLKKAQTRRHIRDVAHRLFADGGFESVTIADVAREADVAVQTVFNHFATKEELFFDGRVPWVEGPADAVRRRPAGVSPLTALRRHLVEGAGHFVALHLSPEGRSFTASVAASPALAAHEQRVIQEAESRLGDALAEAWATDPEPGSPFPPSSLLARLTAAVWLAASRVVFVEQRRLGSQDEDPARRVAELERLVDQVLSGMHSQRAAAAAGSRTDTGWPPARIRQAS